MKLRSLAAAAALLALAACGAESGPVTPPLPAVSRVEVSLPAATLYIGQTAQLSATPRDDAGAPVSATVTYASSTPAVASVSESGLVTGIAPGSATITARAGGKTGTVEVTVQPVPAAAIEVAPGRAFILTGDTLQLAATVQDSTGAAIGGHSVAWSLSDSTVASVSAAGRLVPLRAGRVTVRATASGRTAESTLEINVGRGARVPELAVYDSVIPALMKQLALPGASLGVLKDGKLVLARSYGWADTTLKQPVEPASRFRYASLSKPITATAVMKLVEQGKLSLDDKVFEILDELTPPEGATPDPRLGDITVRHLLTHTTGWHPADVQDPLWMSRHVSRTMQAEYPATARTHTRYWMGQPLSADPGSTWRYNNLGYVIAAVVVEAVSGRSYEQFVREEILGFAGADILAGRTKLSGRHPDEVRYYYHPVQMEDNTAPSGTAPAEHGQHALEGNLAAAGWVGSAVDYLRFVAATDANPARPDVLAEGALQQMFERSLPIFANSTTWYGLGWYSRGGFPTPNAYHGGHLWGTVNWVRRLSNGATVVLLTNGPASLQEVDPKLIAVNNALVAAAGAVTSWPSHDLFSRY